MAAVAIVLWLVVLGAMPHDTSSWEHELIEVTTPHGDPAALDTLMIEALMRQPEPVGLIAQEWVVGVSLGVLIHRHGCDGALGLSETRAVCHALLGLLVREGLTPEETPGQLIPGWSLIRADPTPEETP